MAQNQTTNTTISHLRHFHTLSTAEKTTIKINCLKYALREALITGVLKNYMVINDSASTQPSGPIIFVNDTFLSNEAANLLSCEK